MIYVTNESEQNEAFALSHLQNGRVDGVLISVSSKTVNKEHFLQIEKQELPLVFFDRVFDDYDTPKVTTDDFDSGFKATEHLIRQGCKRVAYLLISKNLSIGINRMEGYLEALRKNNIKLDKSLIVDCTNDKEKNNSLLEALLKSSKRPDGIFASVEHLAVSAYQVSQ